MNCAQVKYTWCKKVIYFWKKKASEWRGGMDSVCEGEGWFLEISLCTGKVEPWDNFI